MKLIFFEMTVFIVVIHRAFWETHPNLFSKFQFSGDFMGLLLSHNEGEFTRKIATMGLEIKNDE